MEQLFTSNWFPNSSGARKGKRDEGEESGGLKSEARGRWGLLRRFSIQEQGTQVPDLALLLACCVVLGKPLPLSGLSFHICEEMGGFSSS